MPVYTYFCKKCDKVFEQFFSFSNYQEHPHCSYCNSKHTKREIMIDAASISGSVKKSDSELKTVGDLANRNRDKLSDDKKLDLYRKHNDYKEAPPENSLPKGMSRIKKNKGIKWT